LSPTTTDEGQATVLAKTLAGMSRRLKDIEAQKTSAHLIERIRKTTNKDRLVSLGLVLAAAPNIRDSQKLNFLRLLLEKMKDVNKVPNPLCSIAASMISESTLPMIVDLLKWPTCTKSDREILVTKIADLKGLSFTGADDIEEADHVHLWDFAAWAEKQSYPVSGPPEEYPSL
jgi:hypothetical protein